MRTMHTIGIGSSEFRHVYSKHNQKICPNHPVLSIPSMFFVDYCEFYKQVHKSGLCQ